MAWGVDSTEEYNVWFAGLTNDEQERIVAAVRILREDGPALGRPLVDHIKMSRHANMKELRVRHMHVLFAFDPNQQAILPLGGNKEGKWDRWYDEYVPEADRLFDLHVAKIRETPKEVKDATHIQRDRRGNRGKPRPPRAR
ncbi:MAG: type II toxin-antitoxin system RelE/ParE family toxin [Thermomicrobiales bacterium]